MTAIESESERLNIPLFQKILDKITEAPASYDQGTWMDQSDEAPCGSTGCIAGWAVVLSGRMTAEEVESLTLTLCDQRQMLDMGREVLGLTFGEATHLFKGDTTEWPLRYRALSFFSTHLAAVRYLKNIIRTRSLA